MFEIPAAIKAITLGQVLTISVAGTPLATAGYWGLNKMIKSAVAEEKFATQEALDEQKRLLEGLSQQLHQYNLNQTTLQTDIGTLKQYNKEGVDRDEKTRETLDKILLGIGRLDRSVNELQP